MFSDIDKLANSVKSDIEEKRNNLCISGYIAMRCGFCGFYDKMINFCKTEINGNLPNDIYQCPKCQTAIKRYYDKNLELINKKGGLIRSGVTFKRIVSIM